MKSRRSNTYTRSIALLPALLATIILLVVCRGELRSQTSGSPARVVEGSNHAVSPRLSIEELAERSGVIAVGKVTGVRSEWNENRTRIQSIATINVAEALKGTAGTTLEIATPGGEVGSVGELYSHTASFKKDEEVVVFVRTDKQGRLRILGGNQGKLIIEKDPNTGTAMVSAGIPLDRFKARITTALKSIDQK